MRPTARDIEQVFVVARAVEEAGELDGQRRLRRKLVEKPRGQHAIEEAWSSGELIRQSRHAAH